MTVSSVLSIKPSRSRVILLTCSTVLSLTVVFLFAEVYARCCAGRSMVIRQIESGNPFTINSDRFYLIRETDKGKRLVRNANVLILNHSLSGRDIPIKTNGQGFRYDTLGPKKLDGEYRILFLGDSVTLNNYLPEEETFTGIAERLLRQDGLTDVKLINASVEDIGLSEEIEILKEEGLSIHPDLVVVDFYLNDSRPPWGFDEELGHPGFFRRQSFALEWAYQRFQLSRWYQQTGRERMRWINGQYQFRNWQTDEGEFRSLVDLAADDWGAAWQPDSWKIVEKKLTELSRLSLQYGFSVILIAFPVKFQVKTVFVVNQPQAQLKRLAENYGFRFLDLLPALRSVNLMDDAMGAPDRQELFLDQAHLSTYGNKIVGLKIASFLKNILAEAR